MPGLTEELTQRQANRGVTVYSPTRQVRPTGTLANAGTAGRITNPRRPMVVNRPPSANFRPEVGASGPRLEDLLAVKPRQDAAADAAWEAGRWAGPLETLRRPASAVMANPVFRAVMAPLNILDYPRRAVASSLQELADAFNGGDASWSDWVDQVNDPDFGGGTMFGEHQSPVLQGLFGGGSAAVANVAGSEVWSNRLTGLGFDLASDPLNWLTGAGTLGATGRAGRLSLAARASEGGAGDLAEKLARFGASSLDDAERLRFNQLTNKAGQLLGEPLRRPGLYANVPLTSVERRIPGTARAEQVLSMGRARAKDAFNQRWMGRIFTDIRTPKGMEKVYQRLVNGRGPLSYTDAAERLVAYEAMKEGVGLTVGHGAALLADVVRAAKGDVKVLAQMRRDAEKLGTGPVAELFQAWKKYLNDAGFKTDEFGDNYVHYALQENARKAMQENNGFSDGLRKFLGYKVEELAQDAPPLHARKLFKPGTYTIDGRTFTINPGDGIDEINATMKKAFPEVEGDFLETDVTKIITSYTKSIAKSVGSIKARQRLLGSKANKLRYADDPDTFDVVTDIEATMDLNKGAAKQMKVLRDVASNRARGLRTAAKQQRKGIVGAVKDQIRASITEIEGIQKARQNHIHALLDNLNTAQNAPADLVAVLTDELAKIDAHFDAVTSQLMDIHKKAGRDLRRWRDGGMVGDVPPMMGKVAEIRQVAAKVAESRRQMDAMLEQAVIHHQLAERFDHWLDEPGLLERLAGAELGVPGPAARAPEGRKWVDGLGRTRTGPPTHDVTATMPDTSLATTLVRQDVGRVQSIQALDEVMAGLPRDVRAGIINQAASLSQPIHTAASSAAYAERTLAAAEAQHGPAIAAANIELARVESEVTFATQVFDSLDGKVGMGDAKVQALDRLKATGLARQAAQRDVKRATSPVDIARQHRDAMIEELENLQQKQLNILTDGIAEAMRGVDPGIRADTAIANGPLQPVDVAADLPVEPTPGIGADDQVRVLRERQSNLRQQGAFFNSQHNDVDKIRQRDAVRTRDAAAAEVMVTTGNRSKTFTADPGGPIRLKIGDPAASRVEAGRDALRLELEETSAVRQAAQARLDLAHRAIIDNGGGTVELRAELNAAKSNLTKAEQAHARQLKQVYEAELRLVGYEANPALLQRWRKLIKERYDNALEEGRLSHDLDRIGPQGQIFRQQADAAGRQADSLLPPERNLAHDWEPRAPGVDETGTRVRRRRATERGSVIHGYRNRQRRANYIEEMIRRGAPPDRQVVLEAELTQLQAGMTASLDDVLTTTVNHIREINAAQLDTVKGPRSLARTTDAPGTEVTQRLATAYSLEDRALLAEAYRVLREPGGDEVGKVRAMESRLNAVSARIADIENLRGAEGVDVSQLDVLRQELTALRQQRHDLRREIAGTPVYGQSKKAAARETIARIEAKATAARNLPAGLSAEAADLRNSLARLSDIKRGVTPDIQGKLEEIARLEMKADRGFGSVEINKPVIETATATRDLARSVLDNHAERLRDVGAFSQETIERTEARFEKLNELLRARERNASPYGDRRLRQETADLMRDIDVMIAYGIAIEKGIKPSPMVGAFILRERLMKEMAELSEAINVHTAAKGTRHGEIKAQRDAAVQVYRQRERDAQFDVDQLAKLRGTDQFNKRAYDNAMSKARYNRNKAKALEGGALTFLEVSQLDDLVDQLARVYFDMFEPYLKDRKALGAARTGIAEGRGGYIDRAHRTRMAIEFLEPEAEVYVASLERLRTAIQEAEQMGLPSVSWLDGQSQELLDPLTGKTPTTERVADALGLTDIGGQAEGVPLRALGRPVDPARRRERNIASAAPESARPLRGAARRRQVREARPEAAAEVAQLPIPPHARGELEYRARGNIAAGRKTTAISSYHLVDQQMRALPLEEAKKLLERRTKDANLNNNVVKRLAEKKTQLSVFDGTAQKRVDDIDILMQDLQQPPNIAALTQENTSIKAKARRHNKGQMTQEQTERFDLNVERIEQAKKLASGELDEEQLTEMLDERELLQSDIDEVMSKEQLDEADYQNAVASLTAPEQYLRDIFMGRVELNSAARERVREMLGPEMGELQFQMKAVMDQADEQDWSPDELRMALASLYGAHYDTETGRIIGGGFDQEIEGVESTGVQMAGGDFEDLQGTALDPANPDVEQPTGAPVRGHGDASARSRETILVDFIKSREKSVRSNETEIKGMLKLLGIDVLPNETDRSKAFSTLRGLVSKELGDGEPNLDKLRSVLLERLIELGYDPTGTAEMVSREMMARMARLQAWTSSLGMLMPNEASVFTNTDEAVAYFTRLENLYRTMEHGRDADNLLERLVQFQDAALAQPTASINEAYLNDLAERLAAAIAIGDEEATAGLEREISQAGTGALPPTKPPPPAPPELTREQWGARRHSLDEQAADLGKKREALNAERDSLAAQLSAGSPRRPTNVTEEQQFWGAYAGRLVEEEAPSEQLDQVFELENAALTAMRSNPTGPVLASPDLITSAMPTADLTLQPRINEIDKQLGDLANAEKANTDAVAKLGDEPEPNLFSAGEAPAPPPERMTPEPEGEIPDEELDGPEIDAAMADIHDQLDDLLSQYGSYEQAPPEIRQAMGELATRGAKLNDQRNKMARVEQLKRQSPMFADWWRTRTIDEAGRPRVRTTQVPGEVSIDWESSLREGVPVTMPIRQLMEEGHGLPARFNIETKPVHMGPAGPIRTKGSGQASLVDTLEALFSDGSVRPRRLAPGRRLDTGERLASQADELDELATMVDTRAGVISETVREKQEWHRSEAARLEAEAELPRQAMADAEAHLLQLQKEVANDPAAARAQQSVIGGYQRARAKAQARYNAALNDHNMHLGTMRSELARAQMLEANAGARAEWARNLLAEAEAAAGRSTTAEQFVNDMRQLARLRKSLSPQDAAYGVQYDAVEKLLTTYYNDARKMEGLQGVADKLALSLKQYSAASKEDKYGSESLVIPVTKQIIRDGWAPLAELLLEKDQLGRVVAAGLAEHFDHLERALDSNVLWPLVEKYTAFFKAYATGRPGFHVRNAISGTFMNAVANVGVAQQIEAIGIVKAYRADPKGFFASTTDRVRHALMAMMSTGTGQFHEGFDLSNRSLSPGGKLYSWLMNNRVMRWNRAMGERTESVMRLGMALDTIDRGGTAATARSRIAKYHFDYGEVSKLDDVAKRFIPFWTFMSRNFPLQIEQMWMHPQAYLWYQSVVRNVGEPMSPLTPDYWLAQGAFTTDQSAGTTVGGDSAPWYLAPDLPHLRVAEPFAAIGEGDWTKAGFSDINPLFLAPLEALYMGHKAYTGAPIEGMENLTVPQTPLAPLYALLGLTDTGGTSGDLLVDQRAAHIARNTIPPIDMLERLIPGWGDPDSVNTNREVETMLRFLGIPAYQLTPALRGSTARRRAGEQLDQARDAAEIASM